MNKKTAILIVALFLVTCGLLFLALRTPQYQPPHSLAPTATPIPVNAHTVLTLGSASASEAALLQSSPHQYTLAVHIATGSNMVNGVQLELAYDPTTLTNVTLSPGDFFTQPTILLENADSTNGKISYTLTQPLGTSGATGSGTLAFISFDKVSTSSATTTTFVFLPTTEVISDTILGSVLAQTHNFTLPLASPTTSQ